MCIMAELALLQLRLCRLLPGAVAPPLHSWLPEVSGKPEHPSEAWLAPYREALYETLLGTRQEHDLCWLVGAQLASPLLLLSLNGCYLKIGTSRLSPSSSGSRRCGSL